MKETEIFRFSKKRLPWSKEEIEVLKEVYPRYLEGFLTRKELLAVFKETRSYTSIVSKAYKLGVSGQRVDLALDLELLKSLRKRWTL